MSRQMLVYGEPEAGDAGGRANSKFEESKATSTVDIPMHSYPKGTLLAHINDVVTPGSISNHALTQELWRQELTPSMVVEDSTGSGEDTMSGVTRLGVLGNQALRPPGVTPQSTLKPFDLYPGNIPGDTRPMRDTQSSQHDSQPRASTSLGQAPWIFQRAQQNNNRPYRAHTAAPGLTRSFQYIQQSGHPRWQNHRQILANRLQKYSLNANFLSEGKGPLHDQRWAGSYWVGGTKIGSSGWFMSKDGAKEDAARDALLWLNTYGYH